MNCRPASWVLATLIIAAPGLSAGQDAPERRLSLSFDPNGRVTLSAQHVTIRDILAEWARQCGCYVVNADRLPGSPDPVPLQFTAAPQGDVLRSLLRQSAGYVFTPKRPGVATPSDYETIYVFAASAPPSNFFPITRAASPVAAPLVTVGSPDDEIPPVIPVSSGAMSREPAPGAPPGTTPPSSGAVPAFVVTPITPVGPSTPPVSAPRPGGVTPTPGAQP